MMKSYRWMAAAVLAATVASCGGETNTADDANNSTKTGNNPKTENPTKAEQGDENFEWEVTRFADIRVLKYQVPGWDNLTTKQQEYVYYLSQAGLAGRDIMWDQNYRHNLEIRAALEAIYKKDAPAKKSAEFKDLETYLHQIWFSNGIHHHYSNMKHKPAFSKEWFDKAAKDAGVSLSEEASRAIFDPTFDAKKVELDPDKGLLESSAVNFYAPDVSTQEAKDFYDKIIEKGSRTPISYGLNSRLEKDADGNIFENVYKVGGLYGPALEQVVFWLKKAEGVAETEKQAGAMRNLIAYYETGDLRKWDDYNLLWINATEGDIDYIHGFVEVYNDPLGMRGSYESIIEVNDFDASARMKVLMDNVQWFEDNSPFLAQHKKEKVTGVTYKVVNVAGEAGDASPSTPIGVNLPNANWIRVKGSKSVSLGNIVSAYSEASGEGLTKEFTNDEEEARLAKEYAGLGGKLHTALHEVVGHASGKLEDGVGQPAETLQSYASTLEEGRADLVALYFMMDPKMIELGLMSTLDIGKAEYDGYIRNGQLMQLRRLDIGADIEEAHMRNRAWVSGWVIEKGMADNVIEVLDRDGNRYYNITDYEKLRVLFGELLKEVQRIKSQGDFEAGRALVDNYGVKVDPKIHQQVLDRSEKYDVPPYGGFVNPLMTPKSTENASSGINLEYVDSFADQMLYYSKNYSFLK